MQHGDDSSYEDLVNQRRMLNARRTGGGATVERAQADADGAFRRRLLFPELAECPVGMIGPNGGSVERTQEALAAIAARMLVPRDPDDLSDNPAAFTYFGQFVFHDIVFSRVFGMPSRDGGRNPALNAETASLDLSGLYGRGPTVDPHLYDCASDTDVSPCRFPIGLPKVADLSAEHPVDTQTDRARDLPRIDTASGFVLVCGRRTPRRPLIADPRNDDNVILSQLQCTLMQAHNRLVDVLIGRRALPPHAAFERARAYMTSVYRRVIVDDFMRRFLDPLVWRHFFGGEGGKGAGVAGLKPLADLPMEFSFAASRFAHGMVRAGYRLNDTFEETLGSLREILHFSSQRAHGEVPIRANWAVDWSRFAGEGERVEKARRISPFLTYEMTAVNHATDLDRTPRPIAFMDLWRCYHLGIASGQSVAAAVARALSALNGTAVPVLAGDDMLPTRACCDRNPYHARLLAQVLREHPQFLTQTPLFYYVLQEASALGDDGNRLGPVGSYIVGATVAAALHKAAESGLPPGSHDFSVEPRTLADFLSLADERVVSDRALEAYLDPAVRREPAARGHRRTGDIAI